MIWPPTVNPSWASSPAAWIAVLISSPPLGGPLELGGGGAGRSLPVSSLGAPARTGLGPAEAGSARRAGGLVVRAGGLVALGALGALAAVAGALRGAGRLLRAGAGLGLSAPRLPPIRDGRVAGRLASTLGWSAFLAFFGLAVFSVIGRPVYVSHAPNWASV